MYYKLHDINGLKVCLSKSYVGFDNYFKQVERDLLNDNYIGVVILDMLSSNGQEDRFFKCIFLGEKFDLNSFEIYIPDFDFVLKCNDFNDVSNLETVLI